MFLPKKWHKRCKAGANMQMSLGGKWAAGGGEKGRGGGGGGKMRDH